MVTIVLIHSPLVGPNSIAPTAAVLKTMGVSCVVPQTYAFGEALPAWRDWPTRLLETVDCIAAPVFVGHSMGGLLAAKLAGDLSAPGLICLDSSIPPEAGAVPTVDEIFSDYVMKLPVRDGFLPPWDQWWPLDVLEGAEITEQARSTILQDIPKLPLSWFEDQFEMSDWSNSKRGFVRTSHNYVADARRAETLGWAVVKLNGTHMHPATRPNETADAILACCEKMMID